MEPYIPVRSVPGVEPEGLIDKEGEEEIKSPHHKNSVHGQDILEHVVEDRTRAYDEIPFQDREGITEKLKGVVRQIGIGVEIRLVRTFAQAAYMPAVMMVKKTLTIQMRKYSFPVPSNLKG